MNWSAQPNSKSIRLNHPMANRVSIIDHEYAYCVPGVSSEIAFFIDRNWITTYIEPFAEYADDVEGNDTLVYADVPNELLNTFLDEYRL